MSAATISEPFLLASYPLVRPNPKHAPVFASPPAGKHGDPYVAVAVQGDGVHVLDSASLHPVLSHNLGPSSLFACAPATRTTLIDGVRRCTTFAVLHAGPNVPPDAKGKTIASWEDSLTDGGLQEQAQENRKTGVAPHPIAHIYAPDSLPGHILLVGKEGIHMLADSELRVQHTLTLQSQQKSTLRRHFLFPTSECTFLRASEYDAVSLSVLQSGDVLRVSIVGVTDEVLRATGECVVPLEDTDVLDISCSSTGFSTVLTRSGSWHALQLSSTSTATLTITAVTAPESPLKLANLTFLQPTRTTELSLAALSASHVLLAGIATGSNAELVFLLWDLRYNVLLAQQAVNLPATLSRSKKHGAQIVLRASSSANMAVILLAPSPDDAEATGRTTLLGVPLSVPAHSTIAAAMGKANAGARWVKGPGKGADAGAGGAGMDPLEKKALREMKSAAEAGSGASTVEKVFFAYLEQQKDAVPSYSMTQGVLEVVLQDKEAAYSADIVRTLLERKTVSSGMVQGGILPALAVKGDWDNVMLAMSTVIDIPEADVISLLAKAVASHRLRSSQSDDAMQVDQPVPSLPTYLSQVVSYSYTPSAERAALRQHLSDGVDLVCVLEIISDWLERRTGEASTEVFSQGVEHDEDVPHLDKILSFLQVLLDASFLALLAHTPAHPLLRQLMAHIQPAVERSAELELLRGPLEPFARRAKEKETATDERKNADKVDWRRRRKLAHEQAGAAVGIYQVEELVL